MSSYPSSTKHWRGDMFIDMRITANIRINLKYCQNLESLGYILVADSMGLSKFIQIFVVGSERRTCFETECIMALQLQGRPRSLILAPIESAYAISLVISSNLGPILPCFKDIAGFPRLPCPQNGVSARRRILWARGGHRGQQWHRWTGP